MTELSGRGATPVLLNGFVPAEENGSGKANGQDTAEAR